MYCIYCGEELKHHKEISDNLFECVMCEKIFEIYPKTTFGEDFEEFGDIEEIVEDCCSTLTPDELLGPETYQI